MSDKAKTPAGTHSSTWLEKIAWGCGGVTENLTNTINMLSMPIFSIGLGVSPALIGIALAIPRLIDAFTDPIMGNISDNTHTRWGRRRPYIFVGAILLGLIMPVIFMPPREWSQFSLFLWLTVLTSIYYVANAIWSIPWSAMGLELSDDYHDRTRLQITRMVFSSLAGLGIAWAYKLCFLFSPDEVIGVRPVVWIIGCIMILMGSLSAFFVKEWRHIEKKPATRLLPAMKMTLSNKPFLLLCATVICFAGGVILVEPMLLYVNIYHVYSGSRTAASTIMGISGTVGVITSILMLPVGGWISSQIGKRRTGMLALALIMVGKGTQFWLVTPAFPYLQLICRIIFQPGILLMWALIPAMIADVCDVDEMKSGRRREASFSSVFQWIWKIGATLAMMLSGVLLSIVGANVSAGVALPPETVFKLRLILACVPPAFAAVAFACLFFYPLSQKRMDEIKEELRQKNIHRISG